MAHRPSGLGALVMTEHQEWQASLRDTASRFAADRLAPFYLAREQDCRIERALIREMGELGLIAPKAPEEFGGLGLGTVASGIVMEAIAYGDFNVAYMQLLGSLLTQIIATHAPKALAQDWVPRILAGDALVAIALTEPRGGSDAARLMLRARRDGSNYLLSGEKTSISCADQADAVLVFARTGTPEDGARGISAFLVATDTPGLTRTRFNDVGSRIVGRGSLFFDGVRVPETARLGAEGAAFQQVMQGFDYSRALIGLQCCAAAQASLDESWRYANTREAFGTTIGQHQGVSFPLADGEARIEAARRLCYHTLRLRDAGEPHTTEAAMCKLLAPRTSVEVIHECLLAHGHYGWSMELPYQQRLRDVMGLEIGDGTAQIMKMIIARDRLAAHRS
jgi:cyclohexanecarboxyl-CoA dehydrogenase